MGASTFPDANASWQDARALGPAAGVTSTTGWLPDGPGAGASGGLGMVPTQADAPQVDAARPRGPQSGTPQPAAQQFGASQFGAQQFGAQQFGASQFGAAPFGAAQVAAATGQTPALRGRPDQSGGRFGTGRAPSGPAWTPRTDGVSVAAFICSLLVWPVGLVLSLVGLRRTAQPSVRGHGLAVAALVLSLLAGGLTGLAAFSLGPIYLQQYRAAQEGRVSAALVDTRTWVLDMQARNGGYPLALDSTAPRTDPVLVRLVADPNGGAPCLDASLGGTTMTATPQTGYQPTDGTCG